jgi:hypothetical protein
LFDQWITYLVNFWAGWFGYLTVFWIRSIALLTEQFPNIFSSLLGVVLTIVSRLVLPLFGSPTDQVAAFNLAGVIGQNASIVFEMFYNGFAVFNLTWPFLALSAALLLKTIQLVVALYLFIKSLIPMA